MPGTGLAFSVVLGLYDTGNLVVFYQTADQGLCFAGFNESQGWTTNENNAISELSTQAPLASFTWNASAIEYLDIVSTGPSGVAVNYYNFTKSAWTSVPSSGVLAEVQNYSAIAANDASHIYVLQDGVKEYQLAPGMAYTLPSLRTCHAATLVILCGKKNADFKLCDRRCYLVVRWRGGQLMIVLVLGSRYGRQS